jgi:hypothetical protein
LLVAGLLAVATPAMAQFAGTGFAAGVGDPLTIAASGVLIPYFGSGADVSLLELTNPAPFAIPEALSDIPRLHLVFFNAACSRLESVISPLTPNDVLVINTATVIPNSSGLIAIANSANNGLDLVPLNGFQGLHSRVYWVNGTTGRSRILEPIILDAFGLFGGVGTQGGSSTNWSPLRSGISFMAPNEPAGSALHTQLILICPKTSIQGPLNNQGIFPAHNTAPIPGFNFPRLDTTDSAVPTISFKVAYPNGSLRGRVYDDDENFLRDVVTDCDCLQTKAVTSISSVYATATTLTYTELESDNGNVVTDFAFTGYKTINITGSFVDLFGRLSGGSRIDHVGAGVGTAGNR